MKELKTEITIQATPETVWKILTDFQQYEQWNPFIRSIQGEPLQDTQLKVQIHPPGGNEMTFQPRVLMAQPHRELRWLGRLGVPGLFDGEHQFRIEPLGKNQVRFIHREQFSGLLVPLLWKSLDTKTRQGFEAMNHALKTRAESSAGV